MMFSVNIEQEFSILLDTDGVGFYVGDNESPAITITLEGLVNEFLDSRTIAKNVVDVDDVEKVRDTLRNVLKEIEIVLNSSQNGKT